MLFLLFSHALIEHQSFTVDFNPNCSEFMTLNGQQDYLYLNKTNELHLWIMQNTSYEVYSALQNESVIFSWPEKSINGIPMKLFMKHGVVKYLLVFKHENVMCQTFGVRSENKGFNYICIVIDCFTKFVWIKPLKSKTATQVVKSLSLLLMTERPNLLQADQGTEFFNKNFSKMLEAFGPKLYHTYSDKKASQVERVQRTIRQRLGRVFTLNNNNKWIDIIDDVINSYNNSFHRSIKMKPVDVKMEHVAILRHRLNY